ncbi:hypothetical protein BDV96DRAFT_150183 [Lophiotrema nucula]|uniref:RING-type domain-containing protein n=1 Tax=Lophiotrema nucula TaxID=690887 RepID=A0A6A5Z0V5_9PLEO|nr:hypothetical protein BDV96DRAFT_150183 [Lophiotrema nucula]
MEDEGFGAPSWSFGLAVPRDHDFSNRTSPHPHASRLQLPSISHHVPSHPRTTPPASPSPTARPSYDSASASGSDNMPAAEPQTRRFAGDGFDYRRPMRSWNPLPSRVGMTVDNAIDLTEQDEEVYVGSVDSTEVEVVDARPARERSQLAPRMQRPPRFARDIISRDDVRPGDGAAHQSPVHVIPDSPEIAIVDARTIPQAQRAPIVVDDGVEGEDEIQITGENRRAPPPPPRARPLRLDTPDHVLRTMAERFRQDERDFQQFRARTHRQRQNNPAPRQRATALNLAGFIGLMNYQDVGFDLGLGGIEREREPAPPTYDKPAPVPEGFTRSPQENDTVVCPNCGDELCTGESEQKKQVWIVKGCGHAYCGECTTNRYVRKSTKGKEKIVSASTKPFKTCVVEACDKKVSNQKAMIQVFL